MPTHHSYETTHQPRSAFTGGSSGNDSHGDDWPILPGLDVAYFPDFGYACRTTQRFPAGITVIDLRQCTLTVPAATRYSIQVGVGKHIDGAGTRYLNHSCDPNVFVDAATLSVTTLRPLSEHEGLFFFYPANEWKMSVPFRCNCHSDRCIGTIAGASAIPLEILRPYRLNRHINELITRDRAER